VALQPGGVNPAPTNGMDGPMKQRIFLVAAICVAFFVGAVSWIVLAGYRRPVVELPAAAPVSVAAATALAPTPPMGWNSWDSFGTTVSEADFRENAKFLADHLKQFGWQYAVVDMEWFVTNPTPEGNSKTSEYSFDDYGRYVPAPKRFPSSVGGAGFKPLADWTHSLGLKFGIHILQGIPKVAVNKNLAIDASKFHATEAGDTSDTCKWNYDNYGMKTSGDGAAAAQAYYDSIALLYASWGVDFIKVDCISSRPYKGEDIRMLSTALRKTGRPIVLSLSPGAAPIEKIDEMRKYANLWRISDDVWDLWHSTVEYPQGLGDQFPRVSKWAGMWRPDGWPDADMLPLGYLGPAPGWGKARVSRLTHDEQRSFVTLWSIFRSPLMVGANLPKSDAWTMSLLTNAEVITVDQKSKDNRVAVSTDSMVIWTARPEDGDGWYVAVFNLEAAPQSLRYSWSDLGIAAGSHAIRDLWGGKDLPAVETMGGLVAPHGCLLYRVK
jgi:alpha-galactosidase